MERSCLVHRWIRRSRSVCWGGEPGSPIIALDEAIQHPARIQSEVAFLFIEADQDRAEYLKSLLAEKEIPSNFKYQVHNSKFDTVITDVLDDLEEQRRRMAPAFALVDPFGYSQTPMEVIRRLFQNPRCEVMITFMYQFINRFVSEEGQWDNLDKLYGTDAWREVFGAKTPEERRYILHSTYLNQLEDISGAKHILPFEMEDSGGRTEYFLFFCTNSLAGVSKMKHAMWSVDPTGNFRYAYAGDPNQLRLLDVEPDFEQLRDEIATEFKGTSVVVEKVEEFVLLNTPFLDTHYKRQVLIPMERAGEIDCEHPTRNRRRSQYPSGTIITFKP